MTIGNTEQTFQGTVIKKTNGQLGVQFNGQTIACVFSSRFLKQGSGRRSRQTEKTQGSPDPVAVGDEVSFISGANGMGQIVAVLPRRSQLSRRSAVAMPGAHAFEQVLVANVDQVVPVFAAANPAPHWNMLDRYLVTAEAYHLPVLICITKLDLVSDADPG
jgi:putative ribosome biogenesis GTPase RsgA